MKRLFFLIVLLVPVMAFANAVENDTMVQSKEAQLSVSKIRIDPEILKTECPEAFTRYYKAKQLKIAGWTLFGTGLAALATGLTVGLAKTDIAYSLCPEGYDDYYYNTVTKTINLPSYQDPDRGYTRRNTEAAKKYKSIVSDCGGAGYCLSIMSFPLIIASIPILSVGYSYQKDAARIYDNMCVRKQVADAATSQAALAKYIKAQKVKTAGWSLFAAGQALTIIGHGLMFGNLSDPSTKAGLCLIGIALPTTIASIIVLPVGYTMESQAESLDMSVREKKKVAAFSLNLQSSSDGVGIALRF